MHFTEVETHKARKVHRCEWCWQKIDKGAMYKRYRFFDHGDVGTVKAHPECYAAILEAAKEEGGCVEWTPGQERPQLAADPGATFVVEYAKMPTSASEVPSWER